MPSANLHSFADRHIGPDPAEQAQMLAALGLDSIEALIDQTVPAAIRLTQPLPLPGGESEHDYLERLAQIAARNRLLKSHIGTGYYDCVTPPVIARNVFENPAWYTPYTPYQAEISQGRLESLINFQTLVIDLTGLEIANASLLDEATAAAEAMTLLHRMRPRAKKGEADAQRFAVSERTFPQVLDVLQTRAAPLGIELLIGDVQAMDLTDRVFGVLVQYPDDHGTLTDGRALSERAHAAGARVAVGTDLLALTLAVPPGEMGADIAYGSAQRFGVPLGYGGPHAAFFATRTDLQRGVPGRIIGLSVDRLGTPGYRLALQTREQHIRREKATSNICTAQALLANMAAMYAVYHGPDGLRAIAGRIHRLTAALHAGLSEIGCTPSNDTYFDTLHLPVAATDTVRQAALRAGINLRYFDDGAVGVSLDETTSAQDVDRLIAVFAEAAGKAARPAALPGADETPGLPGDLRRQSPFLTHPVFHAHRSETKMMRYIKRLERKDLGLDTAMIPLGSCTMKLNAAVEMTPVSWPAFSRLHAFAPADQAQGYRQIINELESMIAAVTGLDAVSLQPNSGAQGEYAGLLAIHAWHTARGEAHRRVVLIPASAHGTNPASASMAGMEVVVVACDDAGYVDMDDLQRQVERHRDDLAALMVTYPSTYGVFEEQIRAMVDLVHAHGGQVYLDGANLNAQVGLTSPGAIGADVCHLNLHKTFAIPHGGGGPGMGPIAVAGHLAPYLPGHAVVDDGRGRRVSAVSATPWGSASILLISYGYMRLLGGPGMTQASRMAILNANYIKHRLEPFFPVPYSGGRQRVAHELIFDCRPFKAAGITETDIAKRLMDYGFHAPTVSWPVPGTMMVEPTESESKAELDRFCDAMVAIHGEIQAVLNGEADREDNVLRNAPHTAAELASDDWAHPYTRRQAAYPLPFVEAAKFWPATARIDNTHGDRNLVCSCPPVSDYA